jgi:hypothetical protein
MPTALVIDSHRYAIYVRVLAGEGDGPLIYVDAHGHIHVVGGGDPGPLRERLTAGVKQIEAGVTAIHEVVAKTAHQV